MSKSTFGWILIPICLIFVLFHMKHEVGVKEDKLRILNKQIAEHKEAIDVLHAEITHLSHPQRMANLNQKFIKLIPTMPNHHISINDIPEHPQTILSSIKK
jgi:hypothetical protein